MQKIHRRKMITIAILTILCLNLVGSFLFNRKFIDLVKASPDPDWLSGFSYRKQHNITGSSAGNQTNYQMNITVHYGTGEYYLTGWQKDSDNPLLDPAQTRSEINNMVWNCITYYAGTYYLFMGGSPEMGHCNITLWTSTDGENFTEHAYSPIVRISESEGDWDDDFLEPHSVIKWNDVWHLYFTGGDGDNANKKYLSGLATSSNLLNWTKYDKNPILNATESWEANYACDPHAVIWNETIYLYYACYQGGVWRTGGCTSTDGGNFTKFDTNPWDVNHVVPHGFLNLSTGITGLVGDKSTAGVPFDAVWSSDGENFTWYSNNPVLENGTGTDWDAKNIVHSDVIKVGDEYLLYYGGRANDDNRTLGLARTTTLTQVGDSGKDVYLDEKCKTDFGDIRFTSSDGTTELDYWIESKINSQTSVFWIEIPEISNVTTNTIYVYYGNSTATTTSNGTNTFAIWDDFEDNDVSDWTKIAGDGTWTASSTEAKRGTYSGKFDQQSGTGLEYYISSETRGYSYICDYYDDSSDTSVGNCFDVRNNTENRKARLGVVTDITPNNYHARWRITSWSSADSSVSRSTTWHRMEIFVDQDGDIKFSVDYETPFGSTSGVFNYNPDMISVVGSGAHPAITYFDDVRARKYVDPKPTHGDWGTKETESDSQVPTYSDVGKNATHAGESCKFYTQWSDDTGLSGFIFSWNGTGSWSNDSWSDPWSGTPTSGWSNTSKTLPSEGTVVGWRIYCNDTSNNWNNTGIQSFTTTDTTAPSYSNVGHNNTIVSQPTKFYCQWTNLELSGFIFGTNNTGSWSNDTWSDPWTGTPTSGWSNKTKTLTSSSGVLVQYQFWCNDTSNNWNNTGIQSFTTTSPGGDSEAPTYSNIQHSTTEAGTSCTFSCEWQDNVGLSGYIFGCNVTGSWSNDTWTDPWSGTPTLGEASKTKTLPSTVGVLIQYQFWSNDTSNNWNTTGTQSLTTTDTTNPTYSGLNTNSTEAETPCQFNCTWTDNVELSGFIFGTDNTGSWVNETWASLSGSEDVASVVKTLNSTVGKTIYYRFWCNDTSGNWGYTGLLPLTIGGEGQEVVGGGSLRDEEPDMVVDPKLVILPIVLIFLVAWAVWAKKA